MYIQTHSIMKKFFLALLFLTMCFHGKAQVFDTYRMTDKLVINSYKTDGYVFSNWVQYHLKNGKAMVYRDGFPDERKQAHISIPDKIVYKHKTYKIVGIKDCAWKDAFDILSFKLPDNIEVIPVEAFHNCYSATEIILPKKLNKIGSWSFSRTPIVRLCLPDSVKSIGDYAFCDCNGLRYVEFPATLTHIGEMAFHECDALDTVKVKFTNPIPVERTTFFYTTPERKVILLVPKGTQERFAASPGWKLFIIKEY